MAIKSKALSILQIALCISFLSSTAFAQSNAAKKIGSYASACSLALSCVIHLPNALALYSAAQNSIGADKSFLERAGLAHALSSVSQLCAGAMGLAADLTQRFGGHRQIPPASVLYPLLSAYLNHESKTALETMSDEAKKLPSVKHVLSTYWRELGVTGINYALFQALWFV